MCRTSLNRICYSDLWGTWKNIHSWKKITHPFKNSFIRETNLHPWIYSHPCMMRSIVDEHHLTVVGSNQRHSVSAPHSRSGSFKKNAAAKTSTVARPRTNSMPNCPIYLSLPDVISQLSVPDYDLCRVRSFKKTSKGLVNHGDTVRKMSINSLMSSGNAVTESLQRQRTLSITSAESVCNSSSSSTAPSYFRVAILGTNGVGKTSLRRQMMTSEYLASNSGEWFFVVVGLFVLLFLFYFVLSSSLSLSSLSLLLSLSSSLSLFIYLLLLLKWWFKLYISVALWKLFEKW